QTAMHRQLQQDYELSLSDYDILVALSERGPMRITDLGEALAWEQSRLSHQLRRMEQRGLIVREACVEDNRGAVVRVTEEGRRLAEEARVVHERAVQSYVFDALTSEQAAALGEIADTILAGLEEEHRP
ncbi:MAG TPA: MarR family transcriptional regulator, partial [Thermomicrobiales bacterium]|nr:MarR family transcriptional regulator [Thermomicrobiales bacterium]